MYIHSSRSGQHALPVSSYVSSPSGVPAFQYVFNLNHFDHLTDGDGADSLNIGALFIHHRFPFEPLGIP